MKKVITIINNIIGKEVFLTIQDSLKYSAKEFQTHYKNYSNRELKKEYNNRNLITALGSGKMELGNSFYHIVRMFSKEDVTATFSSNMEYFKKKYPDFRIKHKDTEEYPKSNEIFYNVLMNEQQIYTISLNLSDFRENIMILKDIIDSKLIKYLKLDEESHKAKRKDIEHAIDYINTLEDMDIYNIEVVINPFTSEGINILHSGGIFNENIFKLNLLNLEKEVLTKVELLTKEIQIYYNNDELLLTEKVIKEYIEDFVNNQAIDNIDFNLDF